MNNSTVKSSIKRVQNTNKKHVRTWCIVLDAYLINTCSNNIPAYATSGINSTAKSTKKEAEYILHDRAKTKRRYGRNEKHT